MPHFAAKDSKDKSGDNQTATKQNKQQNQRRTNQQQQNRLDRNERQDSTAVAHQRKVNDNETQDKKKKPNKDAIARKTRNFARKSGSVEATFAFLFGLVDDIMPDQAGAKEKLSLEVFIPIEGVAGITLTLEHEQEKTGTNIKASTGCAIGIKGKLKGAEVDLKLWQLLAAEGDNTTEAATLYTYGIYKLLRDYAERIDDRSEDWPKVFVINQLLNVWFGDQDLGGLDYIVQDEEASELNAASIEKESLLAGGTKDDNYVEYGKKIEAKAKLGDASLPTGAFTLDASGKMGTKIDHKSLKATGGVAPQETGIIAKYKEAGENFISLAASGMYEHKGGSAKLAGMLNFVKDQNSGWGYKDFILEAEVGSELSLVGSILYNGIQSTLNALESQNSGDASLQAAYGVLRTAADSLNYVVEDTFKELTNKADNQIYSASDKVMVKGSFNFETKKFTIEVNRVKAQAIDAHVVKAGHEASTPLLLFDGKNKKEFDFN